MIALVRSEVDRGRAIHDPAGGFDNRVVIARSWGLAVGSTRRSGFRCIRRRGRNRLDRVTQFLDSPEGVLIEGDVA
ncbi:MAG: hypothetical protein KA354_14125 [Phycisphaerae bacterium]|nr:hypothetical protein [Phycisphaerae bacterium]